MLKFTFTSNDERLQRVIPEALQKAIKKATKDAATVTKDMAVQDCPVDTGYLRSTIYYRVEGPFQYSVGATAGYAGYVEFGTRFMVAQPFLRPAFIEVHTYLFDGIVREVNLELNRI